MLDTLVFKGLDQPLGNILIRQEIHREAILTNFSLGARPDGRNPAPTQTPCILISRIKGIKELFHTIGTRENQPIVGVTVRHHLREVPFIFRRLDSNGRELNYIGTQFSQSLA